MGDGGAEPSPYWINMLCIAYDHHGTIVKSFDLKFLYTPFEKRIEKRCDVKNLEKLILAFQDNYA